MHCTVFVTVQFPTTRLSTTIVACRGYLTGINRASSRVFSSLLYSQTATRRAVSDKVAVESRMARTSVYR